MKRQQDKPWFSARRFGYGAGLPIAWQGWAMLGAVMVLSLCGSLAAAYMAARSDHLLGNIVAAAALLLMLALVRLCKRRTDREWKWRWGDR